MTNNLHHILQNKKSQKKAATQNKVSKQGAGQPVSTSSPKNTRNTRVAPSPTNFESGGKARAAGSLSRIRATTNREIENAIAQAQESARAVVKEKDEMWGRIAMAAETPGKIEDYQIKHIVNAILDCALPVG